MRLFAFLLYLSLFGPTTALANEPTALTATPDKSAGKTTKSKNPKSLLSPELEKFLGKNSLYEKEYKKSGKEFATALQASNPRPR